MSKIHLIILAIALWPVSRACAQSHAAHQANPATEQKSDTSTDSLRNIVQQAEKGNPVAQNIIGTWYYKGEHYAKDYAKALKWWQLAAKQNNVEALGNIGLLYQYGHGVEADSTKAVEYYVASINKGNEKLLKQREMLAEKGGDGFDAILCAICYQSGKGVAKDWQKAVHYYELAIKTGSIDACRELGFLYNKQRQTDKAQRMFKAAAESGDVPSSYQYAKSILNAKNSTGKENEAVVYLIKAAEAGHPQAQCDLGTLYYQGQHVTKDPTTAVKWFKKAAVSEWALAQWNLALCYIDGIGTERDYDQAVYWLGEATSKGYMAQFEKMCALPSTATTTQKATGWQDKPFMTYLKGLSLYFSDNEDINGAYAEFKKIRKISTEAQTMMSVCLANKKFKKPNATKAVKELTKAADAGNNAAKFYLASLYEAGNGADKDTKKAQQLYQASANGGYAVAQCYMGNLCYEGRIVSQNYAEAVRYYKMAEEQGQLTATAIARYADCYERGLGGLKADAAKAKKLKARDAKNHVIPMLHKVE